MPGRGEGRGGRRWAQGSFPLRFRPPTHPKLYKIYKATKKMEAKDRNLTHERRRLLATVNEMMAAHKNAVVIANIRETTRLGAWDRIMEIGAVELINWRAKQGVPSPSEPSRERSGERRNNSPSNSNQPPRQWQIWFDCS